MNDSSVQTMVVFCCKMPKEHFEKLVHLFQKLSFDLIFEKDVDEESYEIFMAFLEAMENN